MTRPVNECSLSFSVQSLSHVQLFATPMDCSMTGFPVHHQLSALRGQQKKNFQISFIINHSLTTSTDPFLGSENLCNLSEIIQLGRAEQVWNLDFLALTPSLVWEYTSRGIDFKEKNDASIAKKESLKENAPEVSLQL